MRHLLLGGGGREHALAWKMRQSDKCKELYIAPGNAGTSEFGENVAVDIGNPEDIVAFAKENDIDLVTVGSEVPLAAGVVDALLDAGIKAFGPTREASKLEWSKSYAKDFMMRYGIPTAKSKSFSSMSEAYSYLDTQTLPIVIKADGLAAGKGVVVAETLEQARNTLEAFLLTNTLGAAGNRVVIEEYMRGIEVSVHAFSDGKSCVLFPIAMDHKRVGENDTGPNTGGMGAIAPVTISEQDSIRIMQKIIVPTIKGMETEGHLYKGVLFPGVMLTNEGPKVIEFNSRFGDPETQCYMRLLDADIIEIFEACIEGGLDKVEVSWSKGVTAYVVLASKGYPGEYETGKEVSGIERAQAESDTIVFHSGTKEKGGAVVSSGGRVVGVSGMGSTLEEALENAYNGVEQVSFERKIYRRDIGAKLLATSKNQPKKEA